MASLFLLVPVLIVFYFLYQKYRSFKKLRDVIDKIPGPPAVPFFGNTHQFKLDKIAFSYQLEDYAFRYGRKGLFRIWMGHVPIIFATKAESAEVILSSNKIIEKSAQYEFLKTWLGDGLLISGGEKWKSRRKMLTPAFHFSILNSFIEIYNTQSQTFVRQLKRLADEGTSFNMLPYIGRCALDIICETAMGVKINAQENHKSIYVQSVNEMSEIMFKYERMPWLWIKPIFHLLGYAKIYYRCLDILQGFTRRVIRERHEEHKKEAGPVREGTKKRQAFLDLLLDMQEENKLSMEDIREEVDTFMFEGHDTTAAGMGWTIFLLGHHPEIQDKIIEELDTIFHSKDAMPTDEDIKKMKYLECVIKESLRLYPPVPMFARKVTASFKIGEVEIPEGANVMVIPMAMHRDPDVFGEDVLQFKPDRFFLETTSGRNPFAYVPFSAGARNCIGQKFALMEEKVVLSTFLRHYRVTSLDRIDSVRPIPDLISRPSQGFNVRIYPR